MLLAVARFDCHSESSRGRYADLRDVDAGGRRVHLLERRADGRIVIDGVLDRLIERERQRRRGRRRLRPRAWPARPPEPGEQHRPRAGQCAVVIVNRLRNS